MATQRIMSPYNGHHMSLREVAEEMGITPERVRQIELKALKKLFSILASRGIDASLILPETFDEAKA